MATKTHSQGKPKQSYGEQVISGLRLAGWVCLAILTFCLVVGGAAIAFSVVPGSKFYGWGALAIGGAIVVYTTEAWARNFSGVLMLGAGMAILSFSTGALVSDPSIHIPRWTALAAALAYVLDAILFVQFKKRRLTAVDRVALPLFMALLTWSMLTSAFLEPLSMSVGVLAIAWAVDRMDRHHTARHRSADRFPEPHLK